MNSPKTTMDDLRITNLYPDDKVLIEVGDFKIAVYRDEQNNIQTHIDVEDLEEGSFYSTILGTDSETHKL